MGQPGPDPIRARHAGPCRAGDQEGFPLFLICAALLHELETPTAVPTCAFGYQTIRIETGIPSLAIRLRTLHPIFASVR